MPLRRTSSAVCEGVSRTRRTTCRAHAEFRACAPRNARSPAAWLKPRSRKRAGAAARAPTTSAAAPARSRTASASNTPSTRALAIHAVVLELPDHLVDRMLDSAARSALGTTWTSSQGRSAWQTAHRSRSRRAPGKPHRQQRGGNKVAASSRDSARARRQPEAAAIWLTMPTRAPEHARKFLAAAVHGTSRKTDVNQQLEGWE